MKDGDAAGESHREPSLSGSASAEQRSRAEQGSVAGSPLLPPIMAMIRAVESDARGAFSLGHPYLEIVYGPLLGPAATLVARSLGRRLASASEGSIDLRALAHEVGLRTSSNGDALGARSSLRKALDRLEHLHIIKVEGSTIEIHRTVPPLPERLVRRLPQGARSAHERFTEAASRPSVQRRNALPPTDERAAAR